jgi:hypothetical protein
MWSSPSRCESTAGILAHQDPFAALLNIPENVACTRAASQPSEVSPLELSVADQIRLCHDRDGHPSYNTHLRMYKSQEGRGYPVNFPSLLQSIAEVWTTGICIPGENGQSLHDVLFAYLSQTSEGIKLRQQGKK